MRDIAIDEWMGASPIYTRRTQRLLGFEGDTVDRWISYDWSDFNQLSFWLYGRNSGNLLFVHILDNRKPSSTVDDAERIRYEFTDDFSGWKKVTIRFADMRRTEIGNGAPVDGLGLSTVHGWAFGTGNTGGPVSYYLDDFELRNVPSCSAEFQINELPMYGQLQKTPAQQLGDTRYIELMTKDGRSREDAAEYVARVGWNAATTCPWSCWSTARPARPPSSTGSTTGA